MTVSVGMFPQKTYLFTATLCHQFLQQLWRDCKLWLQLWIHQTVKAYNLPWLQLWIHQTVKAYNLPWLQLWIHQTVKAYNLPWLQLWIHHNATPSKPEQLLKWSHTVTSYESNLWVCLETPKSILDLQNQLTRVKQRPLSNRAQKNQPSSDFQLK